MCRGCFGTCRERILSGGYTSRYFRACCRLCKARGLSSELGTAQLLHHGYAKNVVAERNKIERNLALLRRAIAEQPHDPNIAMNLGLRRPGPEISRAG